MLAEFVRRERPVRPFVAMWAVVERPSGRTLGCLRQHEDRAGLDFTAIPHGPLDMLRAVGFKNLDHARTEIGRHLGGSCG